MPESHLRILYVSPMPTSPPRSGVEARMHGLLKNLARRHEITAITLIDPEEDADLCRRAMREHCHDVVLVENPIGKVGLSKRLCQLRSLTSPHSFERLGYSVPALQKELNRLMTRKRFDLVNLEMPYLGHYQLRLSPPGAPGPAVVLDEHDVAYELARQVANSATSFDRRMYARINWPKLRRDEIDVFEAVDGVYACSARDESRIRADVPGVRTAVVPNAADIDYYRPRPEDPAPDGRTIVFFGLLSTVQNTDAVLFFLREVWPIIATARPNVRFKVIGRGASATMHAYAGPRVEYTGLVQDLRPHLASASAVVVPIRLGSGTRLKIVEAMAMGKGIASTTLGAEGLEVVDGTHLLLADDAPGLAAATIRLLDDPSLAADLGRAGRRLATERYSWKGAADVLEGFLRDVLRRRMDARPLFRAGGVP